MKSKSEFWLTLQKLARDLDQEGRDDQSRADGLIAALETLPPATIIIYFAKLESVAASLNALLASCKKR